MTDKEFDELMLAAKSKLDRLSAKEQDQLIRSQNALWKVADVNWPAVQEYDR